MMEDSDNYTDLEEGNPDDPPLAKLIHYRLTNPEAYSSAYKRTKITSIVAGTAISLVLYGKQALQYAQCIGEDTTECSPLLAAAGIYGGCGSNIGTSANTLRETYRYFEARNFNHLPPELKRYFSEFLSDKTETAKTIIIISAAGISALPLAASVTKKPNQLFSNAGDASEALGTLIANWAIHTVPCKVLANNPYLAIGVSIFWLPSLLGVLSYGGYKLYNWAKLTPTERLTHLRWNQMNRAIARKKDDVTGRIDHFVRRMEATSFCFKRNGRSSGFELSLGEAYRDLAKGDMAAIQEMLNQLVEPSKNQQPQSSGSRLLQQFYWGGRYSLQAICGLALPIVGLNGYSWSLINFSIFLSSKISSDLGWKIFLNSQMSGPPTLILGTLIGYYASQSIGAAYDSIANLLSGNLDDMPAFKLYPKTYVGLSILGLTLAGLSIFPTLDLCNIFIDKLKEKLGDGEDIHALYTFLRFCAIYSPAVFNQRNLQNCFNDALMAYAEAHGNDDEKAFTHIVSTMEHIKTDIQYMKEPAFAESCGLKWKSKAALAEMDENSFSQLLATYKKEAPKVKGSRKGCCGKRRGSESERLIQRNDPCYGVTK